jgi:uncharacterized repeat protein (TIGR01451 family)
MKMKLFNRIKTATQKISKKALIVTGSLLAVAALGAGYAQAEFYPDRPVFDYNKGSDNSNCADPNDPGYSGGRCGSLNGPVFNSFINTPSYGDERMFADGVRTDQTAAGSYENTVKDVTSGSKVVIIRTYVHNNANQHDNASGKAIAHNTKVRILLPTATSNGLRARSYISADNAAMVEDTVDFTATENFSMEYVPGSATLVNSNGFPKGVQLSDDIVKGGALIGTNKLDGELKGCFDYDAVVEIRVKIIPEKKTTVSFTKQVRKSGTSTWGEEASVKPGETVQYLMTTQNTGASQIDNATVRDVLPPHVKLVPGTVKRIDATRNSVLQDGPLFDGGYNLGSYGKGSGFYVMFDAKALDNFDTCTVRDRNVAHVKTSQTSEQTDTADVVITKTNCNPPKTPVYTCDLLTLSPSNLLVGKKLTATVKYTAAGGATFKSATFNFGDNKTFTTNTTANNTVSTEHTYDKAGNYAVTVKLTFDVNGKTKVVDGGECVGQVNVTTEKCPIPGKEQYEKNDTEHCNDVKGVTKLPDTGAGTTIGLFAAVTAAGAFLHNVWTRRALR